MTRDMTVPAGQKDDVPDYFSKSLVEIYNEISSMSSSVVLSGTQLTIQQVISISRRLIEVSISQDKKVRDRVSKSHTRMLKDIIDDKCVYGCNTSYGARASKIFNITNVDERMRNARRLSDDLVFLDVGVGPTISKEIVRSAILIRTNMLLQGVSGIRLSTLESLIKLINENITPVVQEYGGLGASGDLAHNQRVVNVLRGVDNLQVINEKGRLVSARTTLKRKNIEFLKLDPKEGLALVNGDNFSSAFAVEVVYRLIQYFLICTVIGAMTIEVLCGTDRSFHPMLGNLRPHPGQKEMAKIYRHLLSGSKLAYQELKGSKIRPKGVNIQDGYSLRCLAQFEGVIAERIKWALQTIAININSVSDNPLWVSDEHAMAGEEPWQSVSGGNFLASYMTEVLDILRQITTKLIKRNDRHLSRMINPAESNGLPPNLSDENSSITHCTFKGVQIQSGMLEVYSMALANPISVLFGVHEENNQDITSHAITSGIMALHNLELLKYSMASNLLAVAQATDLRGGPELLSPKTRPVYEFVRRYSKRIKRERPLAPDIEKISRKIEDGSLMKIIQEQVFVGI